MGCKQGKIGLLRRGSKDRGKSKGRGKGSAGDDLNDPPAPAPPDSRLPLTAKQKYTIMASWKGISRAMEPTGVLMFIKLFEDHQDLLNLFEKFKELKTKEQQAESMELAEHATRVMSTLDESIKGLDNLDFYFDFLYQVGASHRKIPGFKKEYFWRIEKPFLESVKSTLGDRYTDNVESIYKITIKFIIETLIDGYSKDVPGNSTPST